MLSRIAMTGVVALALAALAGGALLVRHPLLRFAAREAAGQELAKVRGRF